MKKIPTPGRSPPSDEPLSDGITVSYWRDLDSIAAWKRVVDHLAAQRLGRDRWYAMYRVRIALVEREYGFANRGT